MKINTYQPLVHNRSKITKTITTFWDRTSEGWHKLWGPHFHHGYYENNQVELTPIEAQEKLMVLLADKLDIQTHDKILDAGCGIGSSSFYLAKKYQADVTGITLSSRQVQIANETKQRENISNTNFKVEDALSLKSFASGSFDVVWSLESCEQFFDKKIFIQQAIRVLKPGGKLMLATWCSDREEYQNQQARKYKKLCNAFDLPYMPTMHYYETLLRQQGFLIQETIDLTEKVKKTWDVGVSIANAINFLKVIRVSGLRGYLFRRKVKLMQEAYHLGRIKYGVFIAHKSR